MKEPFQGDVLVGSIGKRSADGDGEYPALKLFEGDVDGVGGGFGGFHEYGCAHGDLKSPRTHYSSLLETGDFWRSDPDSLFLARFLELPRTLRPHFRRTLWWHWRGFHLSSRDYVIDL